ncbi:unnamed protein product, partial [Schistosoma curassoni]|uniref:Endonuclease/exonuclease/phosphatase domain-containing protein n=1 Tax=Schistosoma curassoni TaxID=6186 RepID=A0A183L655_9TREM
MTSSVRLISGREIFEFDPALVMEALDDDETSGVVDSRIRDDGENEPDRCCYLDVVVGLACRDEATELYWLEQPFLMVLSCQTGTSRTTLPRCGQPGSHNRPHTSNSTQDHCIHNQPPSSLPIIPPTSTFTSKLPLSASPSSVTIANDSTAQNTVPGLLKLRSKLYIGAFNVHTLCQIGQQSSLARALESRTIDVCCVSETRMQDPSVFIHLTSPRQNGEPTRYTLRVSGDPTASSRGLAGVGIALSMKVGQALLEWIPVNSRLCAVRLNGS